MITETVQVKGFADIAARMRAMGSQWTDLTRDALTNAADVDLYDPIISVTPMSAFTNPTYCNSKGVPFPSARRKYGKMNLRNDYHVKVLSDGTVQVGFAFVPYASAVHEMDGAVHWSTPNTGARYLDEPLKATLPKVTEDTARNIDSLMRQRGWL
ncbi:MAG: hypothetical protein M0P21_08695 [Methanoculleus sp.]|nr:hypothetical protein [Methanoculleus sp.]